MLPEITLNCADLMLASGIIDVPGADELMTKSRTRASASPIMSSASTQIVLITGANQGLGYFAALQLAQLPGYHIFLGSRNPQKGIDAVAKIQAEGVKSMIEPLELDVDSDTSIAAAVKIVEAKFGKLDVLVVRHFVSCLLHHRLIFT
jgi:enoyl-[acyl-carrier-protein] reductase (NADH)